MMEKKSSHESATSVNEQWLVTHSITLFQKTKQKKTKTTHNQTKWRKKNYTLWKKRNWCWETKILNCMNGLHFLSLSLDMFCHFEMNDYTAEDMIEEKKQHPNDRKIEPTKMNQNGCQMVAVTVTATASHNTSANKMKYFGCRVVRKYQVAKTLGSRTPHPL